MIIKAVSKKGYHEKQAAIVVCTGSADMPSGFAHFLEHKMFEDPDLNMFEEFTQLGASVNAYTNFTHTVYYFNTIDNFYENLELLFRLVKTPNFTEENVEKEKGIVLSEIDMYADNPYWQVYTGLHKALFSTSPLRHEILGTKESVQSIRPENLYENYNRFYKPDNMALICVGDLEQEQISEFTSRQKFGLRSNGGRASIPHNTGAGDEPAQVSTDFYEQRMAVSMPLFQLGFKALYSGLVEPVTLAASSILADMLAGESSEVYVELYEQGMIDNQFTAEYIGGTYYGIFMFAGTSSNPEAVKERILNTELDESRFEVIKNKHIGRFIRSMNSIDTICGAQADLITKGQTIESMLEAFHKVSLSDVRQQKMNYLRPEKCALSVISPI